MKTLPVSVQLYTLRQAAADDFVGVLKKVAEYGYAGVEFAGLHGHRPAEVRRILDDLGLVASSSGGALPDDDNLAEMVEAAQILGYRHYMTSSSPFGYDTRENTVKSAQALNIAAEKARQAGIELMFHNHDGEFNTRFDGVPAFSVIMDHAPALQAEVDTYWVATGGGDAAAAIRQYGDRIPLVHIKDGPMKRGEPMTAVGMGGMEWPPIMAAIEASAAGWLVVELDDCATDMFDAVRDSLRYLIDSGYGHGR